MHIIKIDITNKFLIRFLVANADTIQIATNPTRVFRSPVAIIAIKIEIGNKLKNIFFKMPQYE